MWVIGLMLGILFAILCYRVGVPKGYSAFVCAAAGLFYNLFALIVVYLLPDQTQWQKTCRHMEAQEETYLREIAALRRQIDTLQTRDSQPAAQETQSAQPTPAAPETQAAQQTPPAFAVFPCRTRELIVCPGCGRKQQGNRSCCYLCKLEFRYEEDPDV